MAQQRFECSETWHFTKGTGGAYAAHYLIHGPVDKSEAMRLAIATLFGPVGAAMQGASREEVERLISDGAEALQSFHHLAKTRLVGKEAPSNLNCSDLDNLTHNQNGASTAFKQGNTPNLINLDEEF